MSDVVHPFPGLPPEKRSFATRYFEVLDKREDAQFQVLTRMDMGEEFAECSTYNHECLRVALQVEPRLLLDANSKTYSQQLRMRSIATFSNYSAGACALRDYIGVWSREHRDIAGIDVALMGLKNSPAFKVVKCIRNRMMHGAVVFSGVKVVVHTIHSSRSPSHRAFLIPTEATLEAIKDESRSRGGRIADEFKAGEDWMQPLIDDVQTALTLAWTDARAAFRTRFGSLDDQRDELQTELDSLAAQLLPWTPSVQATVTDASGTRSLGRGVFQATPEQRSKR